MIHIKKTSKWVYKGQRENCNEDGYTRVYGIRVLLFGCKIFSKLLNEEVTRGDVKTDNTIGFKKD